MLQIGAFSKICHVSVKALHHYDKIGLLIPAEVDSVTGYRYYRVEQIDIMNYIRRLKRYGFSLEEIRTILTLSDKREISAKLRKQRDCLRRRQRPCLKGRVISCRIRRAIRSKSGNRRR